MKIFLFFLFSFMILQAEDVSLDNLLKKYESSESLYKKTKKESAGFLLVYSREDLEKMQAFTLKDVIKTVRMYTSELNRMGTVKSVKAASSLRSFLPVKLYIDNHEVNTALQANALYIYGNMNLYFVDHIEVYQGGSSIAFGNEPGSMVIKLYSKDPSRENSTSLQVSGDSKSSGDFSIVDAGSMNDYNYLLYADAAKINYDKYKKNSEDISRDMKRYQAHFQISKQDDFEFVMDVINLKSDVFNGFGSAPIGGYISRIYGYVDFTKYFENEWKISLSATHENQEVENEDKIGISLTNGKKSRYFDVDITSHTYKAIVEKKIISGESDFLVGVQFQKKVFDTSKYKIENYQPSFDSGNLDIYMFYLEELYNLDSDNLLTFSGKVDYYNPDFAENSTEYSLRIGYISLLGKDWHTKIFGIQRYVYPAIIQSAWAPPIYKPNSDLKSSTVNMAAAELEYNNKTYRMLFGYAYKVVDNALAFDVAKKIYFNKEESVDFNRFYVRGEYHLDFDNKAVVEYFKGYSDKDFSPSSGVLVQLFNKVGDIDIYNELVYREGYSFANVTVDDGYDYTLAIGYAIDKHSKVKLKGENILDQASKTVVDAKNSIKIPAIEQRAIVTYEYTF